MRDDFIDRRLLELGRYYLSGILILLPFQEIFKAWIENDKLVSLISSLDELTIVLFLPIAIREIYKKKQNIEQLSLLILINIFTMSMWGLLSGMINGNPFIVTALGIFDYLKNFLVIYIYYAFFGELNWFDKLFRLTLLVALTAILIAVIQELWALSSIYILKKNIMDHSIYIFRNFDKLEFRPNDYWRLGIYRTPSILYHSISLGLYCLLILTFYLYSAKKINFLIVTLLVIGIFLSVSKISYVGLVIIGVLQILRGRRWIAFYIIPIFILLFINVLMYESNDYREPLDNSSHTNDIQDSQDDIFRKYAREKATEIWKDHPILGVGPGMFGGVISIKYATPLYVEYNFTMNADAISRNGIDQFWPHLLAEVGIAGVVIFISILVSLFIVFYTLNKYAKTSEMKGLFTALSVFTIIIFIYAYGIGLNATAVLFSYSAFAGIGLGNAKYRE